MSVVIWWCVSSNDDIQARLAFSDRVRSHSSRSSWSAARERYLRELVLSHQQRLFTKGFSFTEGRQRIFLAVFVAHEAHFALPDDIQPPIVP